MGEDDEYKQALLEASQLQTVQEQREQGFILLNKFFKLTNVNGLHVVKELTTGEVMLKCKTTKKLNKWVEDALVLLKEQYCEKGVVK